MMTYERAKAVQEKMLKMAEFQCPTINAIGTTKYPFPDGEWAVGVNFVAPKPKDLKLPERIDGVKIVYGVDRSDIVVP